MSMILPYHEMACAAAMAQTAANQVPGGVAPPIGEFAALPGCTSAPPSYQPSRWGRVFGAVLAPISGPRPPRSDASPI